MRFYTFTFSLKKGLANIGDYIQVLAAKRFYDEYTGLKQIIPVMRDELNTVNVRGKLIMNGWFTNVPDNWPPSESINPLYVSFHLNAKASDKILSKQENVDYFKRHEPIGCRDVYTAESLRRKGIDAYFSGCLTLTIGDLYKTEECSDKVYIVDPYFKGSTHPHPVFKGIFLICTKPLMIKKIAKGLYHNTSFKSMLLAAQFYNIYTKLFSKEIIEHAEYIQHMNAEIAQMENDDARFNYADTLLKKYARASLIITGRIHCALPSIGMGSRVVFTIRSTDNIESTCRYDGLKELFNVAYISNKNSYIETECRQRINYVSSAKDIPIVSKYKQYKDALIERRRTFINND